MPKVIGIIPVRYQSKRFPGKALALLGGVPLIVAVFRAVMKSRRINETFVATDDPRIESAVKQHGGKVIMTSGDHATGSDRAAEAALKISDADYVVNIQGDEPFISGEIIDKVVGALDDPEVVMSTACAPFSNPDDINDPNNVKVVLDAKGNALYFSRSRIPYARHEGVKAAGPYHHIGIYGFKRDFLMKFTSLKRTPLEETEGLEQLRALEHGYKIRAELVKWDYPGIDSREDLIKAEALLAARGIHNG